MKSKIFILSLLFLVLSTEGMFAQDAAADSTAVGFGINFLEEEIDNIIFRTNEFLSDDTQSGANGPFWMILQMSLALAALFSIIMVAGIAFKWMTKKEPIDVMKLFRPFAISVVLCWWYPPSTTGMAGSASDWCILDFLAYIPNAIGHYTHDLYEAEAAQVQDRFDQVNELLKDRDDASYDMIGLLQTAKDIFSSSGNTDAIMKADNIDAIASEGQQANKNYWEMLTAGVMILLDKFLILIALLLWKIGWWGTIYLQQIMIGVLTIFGPIHWAFSILPKWEGAWAKWMIRYITVHLIGAMLFFVGFYIMLLFDIVISIQYEDLQAIVSTEEATNGYLKNVFFTAGYLMVASVVSLKCLNLVPDLAAWMIPEGEAAFSARGFGEGIAQGAKSSITSVTRIF